MKFPHEGVPGGTAFPLVYVDDEASSREIHVGMSLRDYFAGQAMSGLCADGGIGRVMEIHQSNMEGAFVVLASVSYQIADAMLKERQA